MRPIRQFTALPDNMRAFFVALVAIVCLALIEGAVLMWLNRDWGYRILSDPYRAVHTIDFAVCHPCGRSMALVRAVPRDPGDRYEHSLVVHDCDPCVPAVHVPWPGPAARVLTAVPHSSQVIVGCAGGEMHVIDTQSPRAPPRVFARHEPGCLDALVCSTDARYLLSRGWESLCAWELDSGRLMWRRTDTPVTCAAFHPDNGRLVAGLDDGSLLEIDAETGETTRTIARLGVAPSQCDVSLDGQSLAVIVGAGVAALLDWQTGTQRWSRPHRPASLTFSPQGDLLASSSYDAVDGWQVVLWDARTGRDLAAMAGHARLIVGAKFSPDGSLYSWSVDGTIRQWDPNRATLLRRLSALGTAAT
jgi:WD40 repeat protein